MYLGISSDVLIKQIKNMEPVAGRSEHLNFGQDFEIILDYAHTYNGILNILDKFRSQYKCNPKLVISGFHMIKKEYKQQDICDIRAVAEELSKMNTSFFTGHCTGQEAYDLLKSILGDKLHSLTELY